MTSTPNSTRLCPRTTRSPSPTRTSRPRDDQVQVNPVHSGGPPDLFDNYYNKAAALKLYVRRVFISDECDELLPKYLSFIEHRRLRHPAPEREPRDPAAAHQPQSHQKKLVRKALDMIRKLAEEGQDDDDEEAAGRRRRLRRRGDQVRQVLEELRKGDQAGHHRGRFQPHSPRQAHALLHLQVPTKLVSLEQYVERMKPGQKSIYYLAGESRERSRSLLSSRSSCRRISR